MNYGNRRWVTLSERWLKQYQLCVLCLCYGMINDGAISNPSPKQRNLVVDHIVPHRDDPALIWDTSNWQTLCRYPCHDSTKQSVEKSERDWFALLREIIRERNTREFVGQNRKHFPSHVMEALCV